MIDWYTYIIDLQECTNRAGVHVGRQLPTQGWKLTFSGRALLFQKLINCW